MNFQTLMNESKESTPGDPPEATENADAVDESIITHEKKPVNATALTFLAILVIGGAGTYFMHLKTGPQAASAAEGDNTATHTVSSFLADGGKTLNTMRQILRGTQKLVEQFKTYPSVAQVPLADLKANPFHLSNTQAVAKADTAEMTRKKREETKQAALEAAQSLKLQSLMSRGVKRMVMINNAMYQEGDNVDGFIIERVTASSVIVKQSGFRFELTMAK